MHRLLAEPSIIGYAALLGAPTVKDAIHDVLREARALASSGGPQVPRFEQLVTRLRVRLGSEASRSDLVEVLNGTGILLHTNLGRAPLAREAIAAMSEIAGGYSNLEYDLEGGLRGSRHERVSSLLRATTGAEDGLIVNNCAAAVLLVLDTFAKGREVVVSRNQLIEIGGGFRLPDVLERSGARLVEVGATNKVYLRDFERALSPETALLLRSHTSNYSIQGFVADVAPAEVAALGRRVGVPVVEDLGSGALVDLAQFGLPHERTVQEAVADGIDLVAFSGDKLLGGPQAGIIAGRSALVARMRANPLLRALRVDKATLAALAATLQLYLEPRTLTRIPFYGMLSLTDDELKERGHAIAADIAARRRAAPAEVVEVVGLDGFVGGGALPLSKRASAGIAISPPTGDPSALAASLRRPRPALVARVEGASVVIDLRTIPPERDGDVASALVAALASVAS